MAKKKTSVGVSAAWIGVGGIVVAAIITGIFALLQHDGSTQSISNGSGNIQARHDINIQASDNIQIIKQYDAKFDAMTAKRAKAGIVCLEFLSKTNWNAVTNDTDGLDEVLGFFDLLGYDLQNQKVSSNDVYEYFCDDIVAYYQASKGYIDNAHAEDPTAWVHIQPMFQTMALINSKQSPKTAVSDIYFSPAELMKYFKSETNSINLK